MDTRVDVYLSKAKIWQAESDKLRSIILECGLTEELKWGKPCYMYGQNNIVIIQGFKAYCALLFFKGVLLSDPHNILKKTGENTRVGRQLRFTGIEEVIALEPILKAYIREAVEVEKAGLKVNFEEEPELVFPDEFQQKLNTIPALKTAFSALTPGRQRAYHIFFSAPKQAKTRASRVEQCMPQIINGKGLNDR